MWCPPPRMVLSSSRPTSSSPPTRPRSGNFVKQIRQRAQTQANVNPQSSKPERFQLTCVRCAATMSQHSMGRITFLDSRWQAQEDFYVQNFSAQVLIYGQPSRQLWDMLSLSVSVISYNLLLSPSLSQPLLDFIHFLSSLCWSLGKIKESFKNLAVALAVYQMLLCHLYHISKLHAMNYILWIELLFRIPLGWYISNMLFDSRNHYWNNFCHW